MVARMFIALGLFVVVGMAGCGGSTPKRPAVVETPAQKAELDKQHAEMQKNGGQLPAAPGSTPSAPAAHQQ